MTLAPNQTRFKTVFCRPTTHDSREKGEHRTTSSLETNPTVQVPRAILRTPRIRKPNQRSRWQMGHALGQGLLPRFPFPSPPAGGEGAGGINVPALTRKVQRSCVGQERWQAILLVSKYCEMFNSNTSPSLARGTIIYRAFTHLSKPFNTLIYNLTMQHPYKNGGLADPRPIMGWRDCQ